MRIQQHPRRPPESLPPERDGAPAGLSTAGARPVGAPSIAPEELARLFEEFSRRTGKLEESHHLLERRVAELRRELAEKNQLLERKKRLEALGLMVAGVAHEVRNPLGSISLDLGSLAQEFRGAPSREAGQRLIRQMEDAVSHLDSVVENMLVFASSSPAARGDCDLRALAEEALQLLRSDLDRSGVRWSILPDTPGDGDPVVVPGDPDQLRCVLVNVIKNAVQAMETGGLVTIETAGPTAGEDGAAVVTIRDTGPGIAEESLERVFVPFFTEGKGGRGMGLGLTIVHSLMESQGGRVELRNSAGGGLEVRLFFETGTAEGEVATS